MPTNKSYQLGAKLLNFHQVRTFLFFCFFITSSLISFSQSTYKLKADSVKISNDAANTELILENSTKNVNGFLYNKGNGRTEFRKAMVKLNDSTYLFGTDTLKVRASSGSTVINNNAGSRIITGSNTAGTLDAQTDLTFNNGHLSITQAADAAAVSVNAMSVYNSNAVNIYVATNGKALTVQSTGESAARAALYGDGSFGVGPGNAVRDIFLSRPSINTFKISSDGATGAGKLIITSLATGLIAPVTTGTTRPVVVDADGLLSFADAPLHSKAVSFQSPTASENVSLWYTPVAVTITQIAESVRGTSPSVSYNVRYASTRNSGSPTAVFSSDRAVTSATGTTTSSFANASIPAGSWIWITTSASSGTVNDFNATIIYRQ